MEAWRGGGRAVGGAARGARPVLQPGLHPRLPVAVGALVLMSRGRLSPARGPGVHLSGAGEVVRPGERELRQRRATALCTPAAPPRRPPRARPCPRQPAAALCVTPAYGGPREVVEEQDPEATHDSLMCRPASARRTAPTARGRRRRARAWPGPGRRSSGRGAGARPGRRTPPSRPARSSRSWCGGPGSRTPSTAT